MFDLTAWPIQLLAQQEGLGNYMTWLPIVALLAAGYFLLLRPEQQKAKQIQTMLEAVKKNDRVETIGGIIATVVSVKKDQQEVVLRLDDKSGSEMRVRLRAIAAILSKEGKPSDNAES